MDSEQRFQQHSNLLNFLANDIEIDLEPNPVKLETLEEEIDRGRKIIARYLSPRSEKDEMMYKLITFNDQASTFAAVNGINIATLSIDPWSYEILPKQPVLSITQNRSLFIHKCIYCGTKDEKSGVDIYNIVCDNCGNNTKLSRVFLSNEDYKYETLIMDEE